MSAEPCGKTMFDTADGRRMCYLGKDHAGECKPLSPLTECAGCGEPERDHGKDNGLYCKKFLLPGEQPAPKPTNGTPIWDMVIADMVKRDHVGRARYGVPLQAHNGRDALQDAYEEALDLVVYLRQVIEERRAAKAAFQKAALDTMALCSYCGVVVGVSSGKMIEHLMISTRSVAVGSVKCAGSGQDVL